MASELVGPGRRSAATLNALRSVGYVGFFVQVAFSFLAKDHSRWECGVWVASGVICLAGVAIYACIGRLILPGISRSELRPFFRPYILGGALFAGIWALWATLFLML